MIVGYTVPIPELVIAGFLLINTVKKVFFFEMSSCHLVLLEAYWQERFTLQVQWTIKITVPTGLVN